jgi:hypothetical protein
MSGVKAQQIWQARREQASGPLSHTHAFLMTTIGTT